MVAPGRGIPEELGNYRVLSSLGSGGMGTAYLVENKLSGRRSVMKVASVDLDERGRERFLTEFNALRQLQHPNIPALQDYGEVQAGRPFLVTEWVEGSDLAALLALQPQLPVRDSLLLARAVAKALGCQITDPSYHPVTFPFLEMGKTDWSLSTKSHFIKCTCAFTIMAK